MGKVINVAVCGQKNLCLDCIKKIVENKGFNLCAVVGSANDWESDIPKWCFDNGIKCYVGNINTFIPELSLLNLDLIFSIQARELFKEEILSLPKHGCINLHLGILPKYRGCAPISAAILAGEDVAGFTLHLMSNEFDTGEILYIESVPIVDTEFDCLSVNSAQTVYYDVCSIAKRAFGEFLDDIKTAGVKNVVRSAVPQQGNFNYYKDGDINFKELTNINNSIKDYSSEVAIRRIAAADFPKFQRPTLSIGGKQFSVDTYFIIDGKLNFTAREIK